MGGCSPASKESEIFTVCHIGIRQVVSSTENFNTPVCKKSPRVTHGALFAAYGGGSGGGGAEGGAGMNL
jgi:hypothetical protein